MTQRTLTALYDTKDAAEQAKSQLKTLGVDSVDIHDSGETNPAAGGSSGLLDKIADFFGGHDDHHAYAEGVRRGHYLLTAKVDDDRADQAYGVLESSGAVDFDRAQEAWRGEGWTGGMSAGAAGAAGYTAVIDAPSANQTTAGAAPLTGERAYVAGKDEAIPIIQEALKVGKREVARGGVRVRSYIVEEPVREQVALREEHVTLERRPVDRPVTDASALLQDRTLELTESAEEAVVAKEAVVKEEVSLRKHVSERTEEIADTVRHTKVEIQDERTGRAAVSDTTATPGR